VIRVTTLIIVLTLTGMPTAGSMCISCLPSLVAEADECDSLVQYMPFVREDLQQAVSGSVPNHAVPADHELFGLRERAGVLRTAGGDCTLPRSPLPALRI